jgi:hypothetical protein
MKTLKKFKSSSLYKNYTLNRVYWLQNYFTRFLFYQNTHSLRFNMHHLGFGFSACIFFSNLIAKVLKSVIKKRFSLSTKLISPFFCARLSLKNYFLIENTTDYYFNDGTLFFTRFAPFQDFLPSFFSTVSIFNSSFFFNNSLYYLNQLFFFSSTIKKQVTYFFLKNNFFFLKNLKRVIMSLCFLRYLLNQ